MAVSVYTAKTFYITRSELLQIKMSVTASASTATAVEEEIDDCGPQSIVKLEVNVETSSALSFIYW